MSDKFVEEFEGREAPETIVILGSPGSGKDTQAEFLVDALGYQVISTGNLARILAGHNEEVKKIMESGGLVSDSIIEDELISAFVLLPEGHPVILDGYPRTIDQAKKLEEILAQNSRTLDKVIYIKVSEDEAVKRLGKRRVCEACGAITIDAAEKCHECGGKLVLREDDKPTTIKHRFKVFEEATAPMIKYYKDKGILLEVDGNPKPEVVREEIRKLL